MAGVSGTDMNAREPGDIAAGDFSVWLAGMERALRGEAESVVPCGTCTACCTSSQFITVEPEDTAALARIPGELLFPAPGLPDGHLVMGYDERGHCPMFVDNACSIYADRPRTCRTYDCRIFPAAGVEADAQAMPLIAAQARRWRFTYDSPQSRDQHEAVRAAAEALRASEAGETVVPAGATRLAVLAVKSVIQPQR